MRSAPLSGSAGGARRHITYANVMSTLAVLLLVIGGGTAVASNVAKAAAKNSVTSKSIKDSTIQSKDLKDGAAVGSADVIDGSLAGQDVQDSSLTGEDVLDGSLVGQDVLNSSLTGQDVQDNSLTGQDVQANSLTGSDIDETTITAAPSGPAGGSLSGTYPNPTLDAGAVTSDELGTITKVNAILTAVAPGATAEIDATCPAGQKAIGGGAVTTGVEMPMHESTKVDNAQAWRVAVHNPSGSETGYLIVNVLCLAA